MDDIATVSKMFDDLLVNGLDVMDDSLANASLESGFNAEAGFNVVAYDSLGEVPVDENGVESEIPGLDVHVLYDDGGREAALNELIEKQEVMQEILPEILKTQEFLQQYIEAKEKFATTVKQINEASETFNSLTSEDRKQRFKQFQAHIKEMWNIAMPVKAHRDEMWKRYEAMRLEHGGLKESWEAWNLLKRACSKLVAKHEGLWGNYFQLVNEVITPYLVRGEVDPSLDNPALKDERGEMWSDICAGHISNEEAMRYDPSYIPAHDFYVGLKRWLEDRNERRKDFFDNLDVKKSLLKELEDPNGRSLAVVQDELQFCTLLQEHILKEDVTLRKYCR